jgi:hypothetical protein
MTDPEVQAMTGHQKIVVCELCGVTLDRPVFTPLVIACTECATKPAYADAELGRMFRNESKTRRLSVSHSDDGPAMATTV